jgi:hypothetical protein
MLKKFKGRKERAKPREVKLVSTLTVFEESVRIANQVNAALGLNLPGAGNNNLPMEGE